MEGYTRTSPHAVKGTPAGGAASKGEDLDALLATSSQSAAQRGGSGEAASDEAAAQRRAMVRDAILDRLEREPFSFDFFQAVRWLEATSRETPGLGASDRAEEDLVRFTQEPSLAFAPSTVHQYVPPRGERPAKLGVHFMGMLGPNGPLPLHLTEFARERILHAKDRTFSAFLDVFNHRMVSLFYRAWAASRMTVNLDRWEPPPDPGAGEDGAVRRRLALARDTDRYAVYIGSVFGLGMDTLRHRDAVPDPAKLHFSGRLSAQQRNPEGLAAVLSSFFGVEASIEEFSGRYVQLPEQYRLKLGVAGPEGPSTGMLGLTKGGAVVGGKVYDPAGAIRIRLGPMTLKQYVKFLPGTATHERLVAWVRNYLGDELWWECVLVLRDREVPRTRLGGRPGEGGAMLGWTSWVYGEKKPTDRADVTIRAAQ